MDPKDNNFLAGRTVSNTSSDPSVAGGNDQFYGIDTSASNSDLAVQYGYQDIVYSSRTGEGVLSGQIGGEDIYITSRNIIKVLDLISEGEIDGIVSGEWVPEGENPEGQLGYEEVNFSAYGEWPEAMLRSVFLNDVPVVNTDNQYNFQAATVSFTNGYPEGVREGDNFLKTKPNTLEKSLTINERLRGPDINDPDGDGVPNDGGTEDNPFFYHPKTYRILNPHLDKVRISIKVANLSYQQTVNDWPEGTEITQDILDEIAKLKGSKLHFRYRYRPIYVDDAGFMSLHADADWYPTAGALEGGVEGLVRSAYLYKKEIDVDDSLKTDMLAGWEFEITRITLDSIESFYQNETYIDSITEVYENNLSYPFSAMAAMKFNAEYFSQIPERAYDVRLLKVKVPGGPGGYDPITRQYNPEPWAGTFQDEKKWTDNPAWIFYDLLTNPRYGVGRHIDEDLIDKWSLYEISKYCDILVPNGEDGVEPRFTCNVLLNTREDAYKVLKDFASVFRSIVYYGLGSIQTVQDRPKGEIAHYTNANVVQGDFSYASTSSKVRPTVCLVRYNDKTSFYKPAIEYVENPEEIRKHGIIEKDITAFACTSRAQAIRLGRWLLTTESSQSETVSFRVGPEGMILRPGDIVRVADENRSTTKFGGRVIQHEYYDDGYHTSGILLDKSLPITAGNSYTLTLSTPSYFYDTSLVVGLTSQDVGVSGLRKPHIQSFSFDSSATKIAFDNNNKIGTDINGDVLGTSIKYNGDTSEGEWMFESSSKSGLIIDDATWTLMDNRYSSDLYSVISSTEEDDYQYSVQCLLHEPNKYDYIEKGLIYSEIPLEDNVTVAPENPDGLELALVNYSNATTNTKKITIKVLKPTEHGTTIGYKIYIKEGAWTDDDMSSPTSTVPKREFLDQTIFLSGPDDGAGNPVTYYIPPRNNKTYYFRVFALNSVSVLSTGYAFGNKEVQGHFPVKDIKIYGLRIASNTSILNEEDHSGLKQFYSNVESKDCPVTWQAKLLDEIKINIAMQYRISIHKASPDSNPGDELTYFLSNPEFFNYTFNLNASTTDGPRRHYDLVVQAIDEDGNLSSDDFAPNPVGKDEAGWDIIEVFNPRPDNYWLTPRKDNGKRPGDHVCKVVAGVPNICETITTEQIITSDGLVKLSFNNMTFPDIAGGFIYLSKHPFSGNDFTVLGEPKSLDQRPNIQLDNDELYKAQDFQIIEIPFEADGNQMLPAEVTVSPPAGEAGNSYVFNYSNAYYMAVKLYDSFDREIRRTNQKICDDSSDPLNCTPSTVWKSGIHIGFARDHRITKTSSCGPCGESTLSGMYQFSRNSSGWYVGDHVNGTPSPTTGTFSCPIWPTQYYSANNENAFKYWVRVNVNGQWEGNGISHLKVLTYKDVKETYDYDGYYEYSCRMNETFGGTDNMFVYPNHSDSVSRCRFRQGRKVYGTITEVDYTQIFAGPLSALGAAGPQLSFTTGASRPPAGTDPLGQGDWAPLPKAGIPYGGWGRAYTEPNQSSSKARPDIDKIDSVNWRGDVIVGKTRPLYGFRRFRVYFDPNNLPPLQAKEQLSSYAIVGLNSWNGSYEAWPKPADNAESLLLAKDGYGAYPYSVRSWMSYGDIFENIPGVWDHHSAGFGAGFGGLVKTDKFFDVHLGRLIDDSYLNEAMFGVVATNDYSILDSTVKPPNDFDQATQLHEAAWSTDAWVTKSISLGGDGAHPYPDDPDWKPYPGPGD